jgi:hypothetical protein
LVVRVTSTAGAIERVFHVELARYRLPDGGIALTNTDPPEVPASIAPSVQGIVGMSDLSAGRSMSVPAPKRAVSPHTQSPPHLQAVPQADGPTACPAATANAHGGLTANQLAAHYDMTQMYALGDYGAGVTIAIVEFETEPTIVSDVAAYQSCYGTNATVNYVQVDAGATSDTSDPKGGEMALDIETAVGLAPDATIDVYQAPDTTEGALDAYTMIANDDVDNVASISWCFSTADESAEQAEFAQMEAQGQTVFASAGDLGAGQDCDPTSQPGVVSVGGTTITGPHSDAAWSDGGGGMAPEWCMPSYQSDVPGLINPYSETDTTDCGSPGYVRETPDVSGDADPSTGYIIDLHGSWQQWGGTSGASPLWAAVAALVDASPFCAAYGSGDAGVQPQGLYAIMAGGESYGTAIQDVITGNNDYPATTGYDLASGLGTPLVGGTTASGSPSTFYPGLAALMCRQYGTKSLSSTITGVSPSIGPTTAATTVTISGTGFLPIAGADHLLAGLKTITPSCSSTTRCTAVLPPSPTGPVNLRMVVEDHFAESPVTNRDRFTFGWAPVVRVKSPSQAFQLPHSLVVSYSASGASSPVVSYDIRYDVGAWNSEYLGGYVYPPAWQSTTLTSEHLTGKAGDRYCFNVRAQSRAGFVSAWSGPACTSLPLGSASLAAITTGWTRHKAAGYYLDSYVETTTQGAKLRLSNAGVRLMELVVTECPSCGSVEVYLNGRAIKIVNTYSRTAKHEVLISLPSFPLRRATIVLKAVTKARRLIVEGIGIG